MNHQLTFVILFSALTPVHTLPAAFSFGISYDGDYVKPSLDVELSHDANPLLVLGTKLLVKDVNSILDQDPEKIRFQRYRKNDLNKSIVTDKKAEFLKVKQSYEMIKHLYNENECNEFEATLKKIEEHYGT